MRDFYGANRRHSYFEGWYFKQQTPTDTLALIPAYHIDGAGRASASLQIITNTDVYRAEFPARAFEASEEQFLIRVGNSVFSRRGCKLDLRKDGLFLQGLLRYGPLAVPAGDIMGPFRLVPFLECRHSVLSLRHQVNGTVLLNGTSLTFQNGGGYLEGDRGTSFPRRYLWTQCLHQDSSIMLSAAEIPICGRTFTGCVGFVFTGGKEYRIATYRGVEPLRIDNHVILLRQGELTVRAEFLGGRFQPLRAPRSGSMTRTIRESAACRVHYVFAAGTRTILDFISEQAGFESNWTAWTQHPE